MKNRTKTSPATNPPTCAKNATPPSPCRDEASELMPDIKLTTKNSTATTHAGSSKNSPKKNHRGTKGLRMVMGDDGYSER